MNRILLFIITSIAILLTVSVVLSLIGFTGIYEQNNIDETFGIPLVKSDHIVIEYFQPANIDNSPKININTVFHAYVDRSYRKVL